MKKILLSSLSALLLSGFGACKKEQNPIAVSAPRPMQEQVADLIRKGDPVMYDRIYGSGQRTVTAGIHVHHGVFHWPSTGGPQDGTCITNTCVCMVCIEAYRLVNDSTPEYEITQDFHRTWQSPGDAELIINDANSTTIRDLKSLDITFDQNGTSTLSYSVLE